MNSYTVRIFGLWIVVLSLCLVFLAFVGPIPQDLAYHQFADTRSISSIANFADVSSNLAYLIVGVLGLSLTYRLYSTDQLIAREHWFWWCFFVGVMLVGIGSSYYHLNPNNNTLVWDRIPMTIAFMSFFAFVLFDRVGPLQGLIALPILIVLGTSSVLYWDYTEGLGAGDLRPYAIVQFGPVVFILAIFALFSSHYTGTKYFVRLFLWYGLAKVFEFFDHGIYQLSSEMISGHTLKHLAAAMACCELVNYLKGRKRISRS